MSSDPNSSSRRIDAFDGLRGLAALQIVFGHLSVEIHTLLPASKVFGGWFHPGSFAVGFFFLLSGFVTTRLADRLVPEMTYPGYLTFLRGRLERLYPTYLAGLLAIVGLVLGATVLQIPFNKATYDWGQLPLEVLMMHHWWPNSDLGWNYPAWSISVLWAILICLYPYVLLFVRNVKRSSYHWMLFLGVIAAYVLMRPYTELIGWGQLRVGLPFILGVLLCVWRDRLAAFPRWINEVATWTAFLGYVVYHYFFPEVTFVWSAAMMACMVVLLWGVTWPGSTLGTLLSVRWLRQLGTASYSLYISHAIGHRLIAALFRSDRFADSGLLVRVGIFAIDTLLIVAGCIILYYGIERPFERWRRSEAKPRQRITGGARIPRGKDTAPLGAA